MASSSTAVFLVQTKLHEVFDKGTENRNDVIGFAALAEVLAGDMKAFDSHLDKIDPRALELLTEARTRVLKRGYGLDLCYVTTGRYSQALSSEAERKARAVRLPGSKRARLSMFDSTRVAGLLKEWLEGAAPPVPSLDFPIAGDEIRRSEDGGGIVLRVFWMNGNHVAELYKRAGLRVFHRNVRGYLGLASSEINDEMLQTLKRAPENFVYLNNGVTVVCDGITPEETPSGQKILIASNPQIINGQQTTRVLADAGDHADRANVLVRILTVPESLKQDGTAYDRIVSQVVRATNHQNSIKPSDLRSNDRIQVHLDRELRKLGYHYARKRQTKAETRRQASTPHFIVTKQEIAQAVAATLEEGMPRRLGRERLFEDPVYGRIFASSDVSWYLARYRLLRLVSSYARGSAERQWAKFVVAFFVWEAIKSDVAKKQLAFAKALEKRGRATDVAKPLGQMIEIAYVATTNYYRKRRGSGPDRVDLATFFKRKDVYAGFRRFWAGSDNTPQRRSRFKTQTKDFQAALRSTT